MNKRSNKSYMGLTLLVLGVVLLLKVFGYIDIGPEYFMEWAWPFFIIVPGVLFHMMYFSKRKGVGLLVPGGILLTVGLTCFFSTVFNIWEYLWPGFVLAPAVGLYELYYFDGQRKKGILVPVGIIGGTALIFTFSFTFAPILHMTRYIAPIVLILVGLSLFLKSKNET